MFDFLKKIFGNKNHNYDDFQIVNGKKDIFVLDDDEYEYSERNDMQLEDDIINNGSPMQEVHGENGETILVDPVQAERMVKGNIPDGYDIPGLGRVTKEQSVDNQGNRRTQQRQQHPANQQQRPQGQQQAQQHQRQQSQRPVQQQGYPQQNYQQNYQQPIQQQAPQQPEVPPPPPLEIVVVNHEYHVFFDLAGVKKDSLNIEFENNCLTVSGTRNSSVDTYIQSIKKGNKKNNVEPTDVYSSIPNHLMNAFTFQLPFKKMVDELSIQSSLDNGILHVTLPHRVKGSKVVVPIM